MASCNWFLSKPTTYITFLHTFIDGLFCGTRIKRRKPNPATQAKKKLAKDKEKKPLSPSSRNNGSQVHKINKWALRKQMG